ncbi:MAG TPA: hypothetical protein VFD59_11465 [Nocardioidaceae bacterium]|nr:hypothetical protein [Nocardioidaceae bacterium]
MKKQIALTAAAAIVLVAGGATMAQAAASSESLPASVTTVVTDSKASDGKTAAKTWTQAEASVVIDWYAEHGIEVQTIAKSDGITYPVLTESAMRAAAEVKGVQWDGAASAKKKAAVGEKQATWSQQQAGAK